MTFSSPINFVDDHRFSCNSCGKCCSNSWRIRVTVPEAERLSQLEATKKLEKRGFIPLKIADEGAEIGLTDDGACPYLEDDGCEVHREVGGEQKPFTCQMYPFGAINTPDGYFVSLSFSCPAVLVGSGNAVSSHEAGLRRLLSTDNETYSGKVNRIRATEKRDLEWSQYRELEAKLLDRGNWADPVRELLRLACRIVANEADDRLLSPVEDGFENSIVYRETLNIFPVFVANIVSVLDLPELPDSRNDFVSDFLENFEWEYIPDLVVHDILNRYLKNQVFGKRLLVSPTIAVRLLALAVAVAILLYYLRIRTENLKIRSLDMDAVEWAFEMVESSIITHASDFDPLLLEFERTISKYAALE